MTKSHSININDLPLLPDLDFQKSNNGLAPGHDALLLARYAQLQPDLRVLDLGSGQGIIALMLAAREKIHVVGLEREKAVMKIAQQNKTINTALLKGEVDYVLADLRTLPFKSPAFDLVVMNPPYHPQGSGRLPKNPHRAAARHALHGSLLDWAKAAAASLLPTGKVLCVFPSSKSKSALNAFDYAGFIHCTPTNFLNANNEDTWAIIEAKPR